MNVEVVTIGDELLLGFTIDTNAAFLGRELAALGVGIARRTTCGDSPGQIASAVRDALDRTGAVITTGGLGPTADDLTKSSIADLFGRKLLRNEKVVRDLEELWRSRGRSGPLPQANCVQALVPEGARLLANAHGTAPGIVMEDERGRWVAMLPGVPREMREMYSSALLPLLEERLRVTADAVGDGARQVIRSRTVRTTGVAESSLSEMLGDLGGGFDGVKVAFLPGVEGVDLRLTVAGLASEAADERLEDAAARVSERAGEYVYSARGEDLAEIVLERCRKARMRLAVAESCTGGLFGARVTNIPGASEIFHGGLIAYDNRVKRQLLGVLDSDLVTHGAVSEPVAQQMAKGIRLRLGTEIGIAITGVAGPGGGSAEKPVGTVWIAIDVAEGRPPLPRSESEPPIEPVQRARLFRLVGDRDEIRHRAAQAALEMIRRTIEER